MRLEIQGGRSTSGRRVRHVIYVTGIEQRWLGQALMETAPDLGRRVLAGQPSDMAVVGRGGELRALRQRLDSDDVPSELLPIRHAAIDADNAENGR